MGLYGKKKIFILALSTILLVSIVDALNCGVTRKNETYRSRKYSEVSLKTKSVKAMCKPTNYRVTCEQTLRSANTSDPKELIKFALNAAMTKIGEAVQNSSLLRTESIDPMTREALDICKEVLETSVEDIQSSIKKIGSLRITNFITGIGDLETWIGGAITFHETCLDAFENTRGDTGAKMKKLLKTSGELTSNVLAMVVKFTQFFNELPSPNTSRRLLRYDTHEFPRFVNGISRKLLMNDNMIPMANATVAQDGTGQFKTINEALDNVTFKSNDPFIIFVKAGVYEEHIHIVKKMSRIILVGEGPTKTKITGSKSSADGTKTFHTATVVVDGKYFVARDIEIENSAGPIKHQAVAVRVTGDFAVFFNCHINGYQDTLYAHNKRQFYRGCLISGTVDFVFGDAQAIFQSCKFIVRKGLPKQVCTVTAQGRKDINGPGALVFQNCAILPALDFQVNNKTKAKAYLGRPWKEYSRTIIMNSHIHGFIAPEGWIPWEGEFALDTCYYGEYQNIGPGADNKERVTWKCIQNITPQIAESFTPGKYYQGGDAWINEAILL